MQALEMQLEKKGLHAPDQYREFSFRDIESHLEGKGPLIRICIVPSDRIQFKTALDPAAGEV